MTYHSRLYVCCDCSRRHQLQALLQHIVDAPGNDEIYLLTFFHVPVWSWCFQQWGVSVMHSSVGSHTTINHDVWQQQRSNWYWWHNDIFWQSNKRKCPAHHLEHCSSYSEATWSHGQGDWEPRHVPYWYCTCVFGTVWGDCSVGVHVCSCVWTNCQYWQPYSVEEVLLYGACKELEVFCS